MAKSRDIVAAGVVSGVAYLAGQAIDIAVTKYKTDDRILTGALVPVGRERTVAIGTVVHLVNSVVFAWVFRRVGRDRLRGPMWARGLSFALLETLAIFPAVAFERFHPAIRDGRLPSYRTAIAFGQQVWRHAVLGVVLGLLTPKRD